MIVLLFVNLSGLSSLTSQLFFVQVNLRKGVLFKVSTGEIESLSIKKHFNKNKNK